MTRPKLSLAASFLVVVLTGVAAAQETVQFASQPAGDVDSRFAAMSAELANLQTRLSQMEAADYAPLYANGCDRSVYGWYGGFELVIVRPHFQNRSDFESSFAFQSGDGGADGGNPDGGKDGKDGGGVDGGNDGPDSGGLDAGPDAFVSAGGVPVSLQPIYKFQATPRIFFGWRNDEGLGYRTRYWILDANSDVLVDPTGPFEGGDQFINQSLNLQALDFELTQLMCFGWYELEFGGGVRYGHVNTASTVDPDFSNFLPTRLTTNLDGVGPTASLTLRRPLGLDNVAILGNVRGSVLFGQNNYQYDAVLNDGSLSQIAQGKSEFDVLPVLETQIGLERNWWTANGRWAVRGLFEAMWWGGGAGSVGQDQVDESVTLFRTDGSLGAIGVTAAFMYEH